MLNSLSDKIPNTQIIHAIVRWDKIGNSGSETARIQPGQEMGELN